MSNERLRAWVRTRRRRKVGDALGRKVHDLLWRPIRHGDYKAAAKRARELHKLFTSIPKDQALALAQRLKAGDLSPDFEYVLSTRVRKSLLTRLLAGPLIQGFADTLADPGAALFDAFLGNSGVASKGTGNRATRLSNVDQAFLAAAVGRTFPIRSRRVFSRRIGRTLIYGTVHGQLRILTLTRNKANVTAYASFSGKGQRGAELAVADAIFGQSASIRTSRSASGRSTYGLSFGSRGGFSIELSTDPLAPVSLESPEIALASVSIADVLPGLKPLDGMVALTVRLTVDVVPDYGTLARLAKNSRADREPGQRRGPLAARRLEPIDGSERRSREAPGAEREVDQLVAIAIAQSARREEARRQQRRHGRLVVAASEGDRELGSGEPDPVRRRPAELARGFPLHRRRVMAQARHQEGSDVGRPLASEEPQRREGVGFAPSARIEGLEHPLSVWPARYPAEPGGGCDPSPHVGGVEVGEVLPALLLPGEPGRDPGRKGEQQRAEHHQRHAEQRAGVAREPDRAPGRRQRPHRFARRLALRDPLRHVPQRVGRLASDQRSRCPQLPTEQEHLDQGSGRLDVVRVRFESEGQLLDAVCHAPPARAPGLDRSFDALHGRPG